jgi:hypothetical protein
MIQIFTAFLKVWLTKSDYKALGKDREKADASGLARQRLIPTLPAVVR